MYISCDLPSKLDIKIESVANQINAIKTCGAKVFTPLAPVKNECNLVRF